MDSGRDGPSSRTADLVPVALTAEAFPAVVDVLIGSAAATEGPGGGHVQVTGHSRRKVNKALTSEDVYKYFSFPS